MRRHYCNLLKPEMIDLTPAQLESVRRILALHAPDCEVRVFGSRVNGTAKKYSDLDLVLVASQKLDFDRMRLLREAFEDSDLTIRVDVLDWHALSSSFQEIIASGYEVLQYH